MTSPMSDRISDITARASTLADWYRNGGLDWHALMGMLADRGFYLVGRRGPYIVAWLEGVRFEL